jgi:hypothetical protein
VASLLFALQMRPASKQALAFCSCAYPVMCLQACFLLAVLRQKARLKMKNLKMK